MACFYQPAYAKKMYKWKDDKGNVFFSDKIPPKHKDYERESLNKDARVIKKIEKTKSKAELAMAKRLYKLKLQQERLLAEQDRYDKFLLGTFRTESDMRRSHRRKLKALGDEQKELESNLEDLQQELSDQQKQAADFDRNNKEIPEEHLKSIEETQKSIEKSKLAIEKSLEIKKKKEKKFASDLVRYQLLAQAIKNISSNTKKANYGKKESVGQLGVFICKNKNQCEKAWEATQSFIKTHSATAIVINNDKLITTKELKSKTGFSLSAFKMIMENKNKDVQIFLDVRCGSRAESRGLCLTDKAQTLRGEFTNFIKATLGIKTNEVKEEDNQLNETGEEATEEE